MEQFSEQLIDHLLYDQTQGVSALSHHQLVFALKLFIHTDGRRTVTDQHNKHQQIQRLVSDVINPPQACSSSTHQTLTTSCQIISWILNDL